MLDGWNHRHSFSFRFSGLDVVRFYEDWLPVIFKKAPFKFIRRLVRPAYDNKGLKQGFAKVLNGHKTSGLDRKMVIAAYNTDIDEPEIITNDSHGVFDLSELAGGTSAAPTMLEPFLADNEEGKMFTFIDGGVTFDNDPAWSTLVEAGSEVRNTILLSIGSGGMMGRNDYSKAKSWGLIGWLKPFMRVSMNGNKKGVYRNLTKMFANTKGYYNDLDFPLILTSRKMDDVSPENLKNMKDDVNAFVRRKSFKINQEVNLVIRNGKVTNE